MKFSTIITLTSLLALTFAGASCGKITTSEPDIYSDIEIRINASSDNTDKESADKAPITRAALEGTTLPSGSSIGVYALKNTADFDWSTSNIYCMKNIEWTSNALGVFSPANGNKYYYFCSPNTTNIYAYYPYSSTAISEATAGVAPLLSFGIVSATADQVDYLYATPLTALSPTDQTKELTFNHSLSMIRFYLSKDSDVTESLVVNSISIKTTNSQKGTMNIATGAVTLDASATTNKEFQAADLTQTITTTETLITSADFLFTSGVTIESIVITTAYKKFYIESGVIQEINALSKPVGKRCMLKFNITKGGISFGGLAYEDWIDGGETIVTPD